MKLNRRRFLEQSAIVIGGSIASRAVCRSVFSAFETSPRWQDHPFFSGVRGLEVIAHRGGNGHWPGETMYAMTEAVSAGADILEMDVFSTADNKLVLMHDEEVAKTTNGKRKQKVFDYDLKGIQELHADFRWRPNHTRTSKWSKPKSDLFDKGYDVKVPSLDDVLSRFPKTRMVIEMKKAPSRYSPVPPLVELIKKHQAEKRVMVASFEREFMDAFRVALPTVATSLTISREDVGQVLNQLLGSRDKPHGPIALQIPWQAFLTPLKETIQKLKPRFAIHPWTVNKEWQMDKVKTLDVNGIITDYPCTLLRKLNRLPNSKRCS